MPDVPPPYERTSASDSSSRWESEQKTSDEQPPVSLSRWGKIRSSERYWLAKAILRAIACIFDIIAIGSMIWIVTAPHIDDGYYYEKTTVVWVPVMFALSFIWCICCITIPLVLKPARPLRPGIAVGIDLVLIVAMVMVGWMVLYSISNLTFRRSDTSFIREPVSHSGYYGHYYQAPNGTVVYQFDRMSGFYNSTSGRYEFPPKPDNFTRSCTPQFSSCEQQDAYVNDMWRQLPTRIAVTELVDAAAWINTMLHLALFVWACVDTHRYRRNRNLERHRRAATRMVLHLERRGLVTVQGGSRQLPSYLKNTPIK